MNTNNRTAIGAFTLPQLWATQALTGCESLPQTLRIPPWLPKSGVPTTADPVWHELLAGEEPKPLAAGDPAPSFSLPGSDGKTHALADYVGKQAVVLAWFPKVFTGG